MLDLYSSPFGLDEEEELARQRLAAVPPPVPSAPVVAEPAEPPIPEGFVPLPEEPKEPPIPEGFVEEPPIPEGFVEEPPEGIPSAKPPSLIDLAKDVGYRTLVKPLTEPVETARQAVEAVRGPEGARRREFGDRLRQSWDTSMEETKAGFRQMASGLLSAEQNPYVEDMRAGREYTAKAKADVPQLKQQIAEAEKSLTAAGGDPKLVGQEWAIEPAPENRALSQKIGDLRRQLGQAEEAATGAPKEAFAGTLSRSFEDVAEANRARKAEIIKEYAPLIDKSRDKELWMNVASSLGTTGPSLLGSMINPLFGLSLMYAQQFESDRSEFLEKGGDPAKADEYAHTQAIAQVPMEILGELPLAAVGRGVLTRLVKEGNPQAWGKWITERATELAQSLAGEVGVVTPFQTVAEQKIGEEYGVKPKMTDEELRQQVLQAQKVAALQVGVAGGGPVVVEAGTRLTAPSPAVAPVPGAPVVPPPIPSAAPETFAPPGTAPGVTIAPAPGEVPVPPDLAGAEQWRTSTMLPPVAGAPPFVPSAVPPTGTTPEVIEPGEHTPAGAAVTQVTGAHNIAVKEIADTQAQNLQAAGAPKTAQAIQQLAQESSSDATVTAAEFLQQAKVQAAEAEAEAVTKTAEAAAKAVPEAPAAAAAPAVAPEAAAPAARPFGVPPPLPGPTPAEAFAPPAAVAPAAAPVTVPVAPEAAPAPAAPTEPQAAVVVGGQVFTGATHEDAVRAAHTAVGVDAMGAAEGGWVDPETGRFHDHGIYEAHQALNTAIEESGGNMEAPAVQEATARFAEAQARDVEINNQIVQPGGEQVVNPGIKGQEVLVSTRPSQELAVPLAGVTATIEGVDAQGRRATETQPAATALNDARNDKTALTILLDCLH